MRAFESPIGTIGAWNGTRLVCGLLWEYMPPAPVTLAVMGKSERVETGSIS